MEVVSNNNYFENKRHEFLSKYQNDVNTNMICMQENKNKKSTTGGSTSSMNRDIPTDADEIIK